VQQYSTFDSGCGYPGRNVRSNIVKLKKALCGGDKHIISGHSPNDALVLQVSIIFCNSFTKSYEDLLLWQFDDDYPTYVTLYFSLTMLELDKNK
jgi:hypothetical protein